MPLLYTPDLKAKCVLNKKSQFSYPELFKPSANVDYYDNICEYVEAENVSKFTDSAASFDVKTNEKALSLDKLNRDANKSEALVPIKNPTAPQQRSSQIFKEPVQPEKIRGSETALLDRFYCNCYF